MTSEHDRVNELLPWYFNGTLNEADMNLVNAHLQECDRCAQALKDEAPIAQLANQEPDGLTHLVAQQQSNFSSLQENIKASAGQLRRESKANSSSVISNALFNKQVPRIAAMLLCAMLIGFAGGRISNEAAYVTLTDAHNAGSNIAQIMFQPTTTERELRQLLLDSDAELLAGPSPKGVYRLRLPDNLDATAYVSRLRQHPAIAYVELELH